MGLCAVNERGRYDFFRDRVMLPVIDRQKRVVGFGSRLLDPDAKDRKYVNSPESPLFHKKEQLYGLHAALEAIRKSGSAIVVEGNFDVLALHEAGIEEAVAPMGTALTVEQVSALGRLAKTVTVVFDGDSAGQRAAQKAVPLFVDGEVDGRVARLPAGFDPDDFVRRSDDGAGTFRRMVDGARPMLDQFIQDSCRGEQHRREAGDAREGRRAAGAGEEPDQARALRRAAGRRARPDDPAGQARAAGGCDARQPRQPRRAERRGAGCCRETAVAAAPVRLPPEELHVIVLLARYPELLRAPEASRAGELLLHPTVRQLYRMAAAMVAETGKLDVPAWLDAAPAAERKTVAAGLMDGSLAEVADPTGLLRKLVTRLELLRLDAEIEMSARLSREAHARGDEAAQRALSIRGIELRKTKEGLQAALQRP